MGIVRYPKKRDYWFEKIMCCGNLVSKIMSFNKYDMICAAFHISHPNDEKNFLEKKNPSAFTNKMFTKFKSNFQLGENITIDESIVFFRGRSQMLF